jgi:hypothetical protein
VGFLSYKLLNGDVAVPYWVVNFGKQILASFCGLPLYVVFLAYLICFHFDLLECATCVCAGLITLLVIIYQGNSSSLVHGRSQEELKVVFAGSLWLTSLTGGGHRLDQCHLLSTGRDRSDRSTSSI